MFNLKRIKLKYQLVALIALALLAIIAVQLFYFRQITEVIRNRAEVYTDTILNQVAEKLVSNALQVKQATELLAYNKYTQYFIMEDDPIKRFEYNNFILQMMDFMRVSNKNISNVILVDSKKRITCLSALSPYPQTVELEKMDNEYGVFGNDLKSSFFTGIIKSSSNITNRPSLMYYYAFVNPVYYTLTGTTLKKNIATCLTICEINYLNSVIENIYTIKNSYFFVLDSENRIVMSDKNNEDMIGEVIDVNIASILNNQNAKTIREYNEKSSLIQYRDIKEMKWKVISIIPVSEINDELIPIKNYGFYIVIVLCALMITLGYIFIGNITRPIAFIVDFMSKANHKGLKNRLEVKETNEIGLMAVHINTMLDEIEEMTNRVASTKYSLYLTKLAKKQAELLALQSQINPHFLYNTLDCIKGIGYSLKSQEIVAITTSMSKIFRYNIKGDETVRVRDEINSIEDYLKIMSIRFSGKYSHIIEIDEQLLECKIPKLILQPIVENSIFHGLERKLGSGYLKVHGYFLENGNIRFELTDNGIGMSCDDLENLNKLIGASPEQDLLVQNHNKSIGLVNVHQRIVFTYGTEYGIKVFSKEGEGTTVVIDVPRIDE